MSPAYFFNNLMSFLDELNRLSVLAALGVVFVAARLWGIIDWPWEWVAAPFLGNVWLAIIRWILAGFFAYQRQPIPGTKTEKDFT